MKTPGTAWSARLDRSSTTRLAAPPRRKTPPPRRGLGTAFLLGRTRFGYSFALCLVLAGIFTLLAQRRFDYPGTGSAHVLYLVAALVLAIAVAVETYFQNERWPLLAAAAVVGATLLSAVLMATVQLPAPGYALDPQTGVPVGD